MTGRILAAAASFLWLPCMLRAQGIQTISWTELGPRAGRHKVVVSLKSGDSVQGKVVRSDGRSLTVRAAETGRDREILPPEVALVRVEPRRGWAGRLIGLAAGIALGTAAGIGEGSNRAGREAGTVLWSAAAGAGIGTLIGWGVGALRTGKPGPVASLETGGADIKRRSALAAWALSESRVNVSDSTRVAQWITVSAASAVGGYFLGRMADTHKTHITVTPA